MRIFFEKVPDSEGSSFGCFHAGGRVFDCPYHIHPEVEILHILSGQGLLVVGDHIGRFVPGDLLLLGSGLPHMLCSDPITSDSSETTHIRYVQFKQENFGPSFWQMPEQQSVSHLLTQSVRGLRFDDASTISLLPTMDRLWETFGARRLWNLMQLLEEMAPSRSATPLASLGYAPVLTHRDSERLNRAIQYMNSHLTGALQLNDVAREAGMSPQAFSRFFHKFMGIPFVDYVSSLRISLACRYLLETDKTIAAICYLCGFNNLSNFNRQFLKHKSTTPKEFKRRGAVENADSSFFARALPGSGSAPIAVAR
jgi:AraC-like DNA-binding protein